MFKWRKYFFQIFVLLGFLALTIQSVHLLLKPGYLLFGEYVESTNFKSLWSYVLFPWNDYFSLGHTNLGFPHASSYISGQVFGTFFASGQTYWLTLLIFLQTVFGQFQSVSYVIISVLLPFIGMYCLAGWIGRKFADKSRLYPILASLIYSISPQVVLRIQVGSLRYCLAYGLLPLVLLFVYKYLDRPTLRDVISGSLFFSLLFYIQPHFIFIYGLFAMVVFVSILKSPQHLSRFATLHVVWSIILALTTLSIWLPPQFFNEPSLIPENDFFTGANVANGLGSSISSLAALTAGHNNYYHDFFANLKNSNLIYSFVFGLVSVLAVVKKRLTLFRVWLVNLGLAVIFGSGTKFPILGPLIGWLYLYIPVLHAFRDTTKFMSLIILAYALLIPVVLVKKTRWGILALIGISLLVANYSQSFLSGNFDQTLRIISVPADYLTAAKTLSGRILYLAPKKSIEGSQDYIWDPAGKNPSILVSPFDSLVPLSNGSLSMSGAIGESYSTRVLSYLELRCAKPYFGALLEKTATNWVIYDHQIKENIPPSSQLCSQLPSLQKSRDIGQLEVYKALPTSLVTVSSTPNLVLGNLSIYDYLGENYPKFLKSPLIFLQQNKNLDLDQITKLQGNVLVYNTSLSETVLTFAKNNFHPVAWDQILNNPSDAKRYWIWDKGTMDKLTANTGDFVLSKLPIYTTGTVTLNSTFQLDHSGTFLVFAHLLYGPEGGNISFTIDHKYLKELNTLSEFNGLLWQPVIFETLDKGRHTLEINAHGPGFELVDQVGIIDANVYTQTEQQVKAFLTARPVQAYYSSKLKGLIPDWNRIDTNDLPISSSESTALDYIKYSPVNIQLRGFPASTSAEVLTFRESYSPFWGLNTIAPIIVDGLSNGYIVNQPEDYRLYYTPTRIYQSALAISSFSMGVLIIITAALYFPRAKKPDQLASPPQKP